MFVRYNCILYHFHLILIMIIIIYYHDICCMRCGSSPGPKTPREPVPGYCRRIFVSPLLHDNELVMQFFCGEFLNFILCINISSDSHWNLL